MQQCRAKTQRPQNDSVEAIRPMRTETIVIVVGKLRAGVGWHCLQ